MPHGFESTSYGWPRLPSGAGRHWPHLGTWQLIRLYYGSFFLPFTDKVWYVRQMQMELRVLADGANHGSLPRERHGLSQLDQPASASHQAPAGHLADIVGRDTVAPQL